MVSQFVTIRFLVWRDGAIDDEQRTTRGVQIKLSRLNVFIIVKYVRECF